MPAVPPERKRKLALVAVFSLAFVGLLSSISSVADVELFPTIANEFENDKILWEEQELEIPTDLPELADEAIRFLRARKQSYKVDGRFSHWKLRGTGYLYDRQSLLLMATLPATNIAINGTSTPTVVRIDDVMPFLDSDSKHRKLRIDYHTNYCEKLTVWVRVNGPEIFAGSAIAVIDDRNATSNKQQPSCHWEFTFDLRVPGTYEVDAKVLVWNGKAPLTILPKTNKKERGIRCQSFKGGAESVINNTTNLRSDGFVGFKLYHAAQGCCEICSRTPGCLYWANPPKNLQNFSRGRNGCELFFDHNSDYIPGELASGILDSEIVDYLEHQRLRLLRGKRTDENAEDKKKKRRKRVGRVPKPVAMHGPRADQSPDDLPYFVGCGWSYWFTLDFPCVSGDLDDRVFTRNNRRSFSVIQDRIETVPKTLIPQPLCTTNDEVGLANPSRRVGRYVRRPWPESCNRFELENSAKPSFEITTFDPKRPHCWYRDNLENVGKLCIEIGCKFILEESQWFSSVHNETQFYGYWQRDDCDYLEFTTQELQECITERKISSIEVLGNSIAHFFNRYVEQRTRDIVFYSVDDESIEVYANTLSLLHISTNSKEDLVEYFQEADEDPRHENYFLGTFYQSSERDTYSFTDYQAFVHNVAEPILLEKNWTILDGYGPSAAFTFDTAAQNDGMHLIGPPMKTLITKFFHHMCYSNNVKSTSARGTVVGKESAAL